MEYKTRSKIILVRSEPGNKVGIYFEPEGFHSLKFFVSSDFYINNLRDLDPSIENMKYALQEKMMEEK